MFYRRIDRGFNTRLAARRDELKSVTGATQRPTLNWWKVLGLAICIASAGSMISLAFVASRAVHAAHAYIAKPSPSVVAQKR